MRIHELVLSPEEVLSCPLLPAFQVSRQMAEGEDEAGSSVCSSVSCPSSPHASSKRLKFHKKSFSCTFVSGDGKQCTVRFGRKQEYERHWRTVHGKEEDKPWKCNGCMKRFGRGDGLKRHFESGTCIKIPGDEVWLAVKRSKSIDRR